MPLGNTPTKLGEEVLQALLVQIHMEVLHINVGELHGPRSQLCFPLPSGLEVANEAADTLMG